MVMHEHTSNSSKYDFILEVKSGEQSSSPYSTQRLDHLSYTILGMERTKEMIHLQIAKDSATRAKSAATIEIEKRKEYGAARCTTTLLRGS
jgi:hypothetical protein